MDGGLLAISSALLANNEEVMFEKVLLRPATRRLRGSSPDSARQIMVSGDDSRGVTQKLKRRMHLSRACMSPATSWRFPVRYLLAPLATCGRAHRQLLLNKANMNGVWKSCSTVDRGSSHSYVTASSTSVRKQVINRPVIRDRMRVQLLEHPVFRIGSRAAPRWACP